MGVNYIFSHPTRSPEYYWFDVLSHVRLIGMTNQSAAYARSKISILPLICTNGHPGGNVSHSMSKRKEEIIFEMLNFFFLNLFLNYLNGWWHQLYDWCRVLACCSYRRCNFVGLLLLFWFGQCQIHIMWLQ